MRILLLGGTDLTRAIAESAHRQGLPLAGVVHLPRQVSISYSPRGFDNARHADLAEWCGQVGIPSRQFTDNHAVAEFAAEIDTDFLLVAGWYHMVPRSLRDRFGLGAVGLHGSLLPKLRGGAPLNWAILTGEREAGVSLFVLGDGVDDGPLYGQRRVPIGPRTTIGDLVEAVEAASLELVTECLPGIASGELEPTPQVGEPSYGMQRVPADGEIEWRQSAERIDRLVRAVSRPYPGAFTAMDDEKITIWEAEPMVDSVAVHGAPGQICRLPDEQAPCVVTGDGILAIREACDARGSNLLPHLKRCVNRRFDP